jgi:hypothetical protein
MANNKNSQYDPGLIVKEVHDFYGQFIRTGDAKSVVPAYFSHFRAVYDGLDRPIEVTYYRGTLAHVTQIGTSSAVGLGGKYFIIRNNPSDAAFAVWYNLDGLSTAPVVSGATLIEIPIMTGDSAALVAMATELVINSSQPLNFKATRYGQTVTINTVGMGTVSNSVDVNTGFLIVNTPGTQEVVGQIFISYVGSDPVYNGQVLKGYKYNIYTAKFETLQEVDFSNTEITKKNTISTYGEKLGVASGVTELLVSVVAGANQILGQIVFSGTNIAEYELVINSSTIDKKRTYFGGELNGSFIFPKGLSLVSGDVVEIYAVHSRPYISDFNARIEIWEIAV